jgi:hypothetical protein
MLPRQIPNTFSRQVGVYLGHLQFKDAIADAGPPRVG